MLLMLLSKLVSDGLLKKMLSFFVKERIKSEAMLIELLVILKDVVLMLFIIVGINT